MTNSQQPILLLALVAPLIGYIMVILIRLKIPPFLLTLGHKLLLTAAALYSTSEVIIGIADGPLLAKKQHLNLIQPFNERENVVLKFLRNIKPHLNYTAVPIEVSFQFSNQQLPSTTPINNYLFTIIFLGHHLAFFCLI